MFAGGFFVQFPASTVELHCSLVMLPSTSPPLHLAPLPPTSVGMASHHLIHTPLSVPVEECGTLIPVLWTAENQAYTFSYPRILLLYYTKYTSCIICVFFSESSIDCGAPQLPVNVTTNFTTTTLGSTATYQCRDGLTPSDTHTTQCTSGGVWEPHPSALTCREPGEGVGIIHIRGLPLQHV